MSANGFDKTWASFTSITLALMLGACAHLGGQDATNNDAASAAQVTADTQLAPVEPQMMAQPVPPVIYKVRRGDSLARIARSQHVTVKQIVAWNHLKPSARLHVGQALKVSSPDAVKMVAVAVNPAAGSNAAAATVNAASGATAAGAVGNGTNGTNAANPIPSAATPATGAPAPSAAEAREVNAEVSRHAKGVALIWPAQGNVV